MAQENRRSEMKHGHRHDEAPKVSSCRLDGRGGYFVLRLDGPKLAKVRNPP